MLIHFCNLKILTHTNYVRILNNYTQYFASITGYLVQASLCNRDLFPEGVQLGYRWRATTHVGTVFPSEHLTNYSVEAYFLVQNDQNFTNFQVCAVMRTLC